eukprot:scaffold7052_cov254-Pinguiococcus_pyrenoidosus.AAC.18
MMPDSPCRTPQSKQWAPTALKATPTTPPTMACVVETGMLVKVARRRKIYVPRRMSTSQRESAPRQWP